MNGKTTAYLVEINHQFYQSCARSFSQTRRRVQPGVKKSVLEYLHPGKVYNLLDVGCGNGELARLIAEHGIGGSYTGLDFSDALIDEYLAPRGQSDLTIRWLVRDLVAPDWGKDLPPSSFDCIFCFAVLHHIPGSQNQLCLMQNIRRLLKPDGVFVFSVWQFLSSPKLVQRIQSWEKIGLHPTDVDEGDYLLDWRAEDRQNCLRYVHHFSPEKLEAFREQCGFQQIVQYRSDGVNDQLGLYSVWMPE